MIQTIENKIFERMQKAKRGVVFFANDFSAYGTVKACNKALERLTKDKKIMRVARGIYVIPQKSIFLGHIPPDTDTIARAIARRDKAKIVPTGLAALNMIGLSTQVPMKTIYLTDGNSRKLNIGNSAVIFKKTTAKNVAFQGKISGLVIQGLKSIGKGNVTNYEEQKIIELLKQESKKNIEYDIKIAPDWTKKIIHKALI
jgi:hypothetical protein